MRQVQSGATSCPPTPSVQEPAPENSASWLERYGREKLPLSWLRVLEPASAPSNIGSLVDTNQVPQPPQPSYLKFSVLDDAFRAAFLKNIGIRWG